MASSLGNPGETSGHAMSRPVGRVLCKRLSDKGERIAHVV
jgi:hypothetical protein